jgi:hypothetical protein
MNCQCASKLSLIFNISHICNKYLLFNHSFSQHFGEFGQYSMNASIEECGEIEVNFLPANIYLRKETLFHTVCTVIIEFNNQDGFCFIF